VDFEARIEAQIPQWVSFSSLLVLLDGLSQRIGALVEALFGLFGAEVSYAGGGAGSLSLQQRPCLFTNSGVYQDAALLGLCPHRLTVRVGHGWEPFHRGHQVTAVAGTRVMELDNLNAFQVYRAIVEPHLPEPITAENFFRSAQAYPLGIRRLQGEHVVRDPIAITPEGHLLCVGELALGDFVDILHARPDGLISAAGATAALAQHAGVTDTRASATAGGVLVFDCISRALFLGTEFAKELEQIRRHIPAELPVAGALVLGEIANSGGGYLELFNKTTVVALV